MKRLWKCLLMTWIAVCLCCGQIVYAEETQPPSTELTAQPELSISAPSAILMEASTGQIIYEKSANDRKSPASITKIMTLLLAYEALGQGKISLQDQVTTSAYAKSMGGSQVFLEEGEVQTVETLLKCIVVASGNDAAVTMAEYIAGSEAEFVNQMNQKAAQLQMTDTHFEDCSGLSDSDNHYTTAKDVAIMSKELITKYPQIFEYTKIWMEDITHTTRQGSNSFTLSSTNKLLKQYQWTTGLKTGSTGKAKYCLSATAQKDGIDMIAVVMAAPDFKVRFQDAITLLTYGFGVSRIYEDANTDILEAQPVKEGVAESVPIQYEGKFRYLDVSGKDLNKMEKKIEILDEINAPVKKGDIAGEAIYSLDGARIGSVPILFTDDVAKAYYKDYILRVFQKFLV